MLYWRRTTPRCRPASRCGRSRRCLHRRARAAFALLNYAFDEIGNPALGRYTGPVSACGLTLIPAAGLPRAGPGPPRRPRPVVAYAIDRGAVLAVDRVSFELYRRVPRDRGESGCGKSTLLFAIARLLAPPAAVIGGSIDFKA